jgi:hypothetical protein
MADSDTRTEADIREAIADEREALDKTLAKFRRELGVQNDLRRQLPALAAGAFVMGFTLSGGIGATVRSVLRRRYARSERRSRGFAARMQRR